MKTEIITYRRHSRRREKVNTRNKTSENVRKLTEELTSSPASNYKIKDAEKLARKVLDAGGWNSHERSIPIKTIAEYFGFKVYAQKTIPDNAAGNIYVGGTTNKLYGHDKVIIAAKNEKFTHQRFIIAHELGHYLMDYVGSTLEKDSKKLFAQAYTKENHGAGNIKEDRADRFAAELLMPADEFIAEYAKVMKSVEFDEQFAIPTLAAYFEVKENSIIRRLSETGLS